MRFLFWNIETKTEKLLKKETEKRCDCATELSEIKKENYLLKEKIQTFKLEVESLKLKINKYEEIKYNPCVECGECENLITIKRKNIPIDSVRLQMSRTVMHEFDLLYFCKLNNYCSEFNEINHET